VALNDFRSVLQILFKVQPDEIYNLAGQSSVSLSFEQPAETQESIYLGTLNLLEAKPKLQQQIFTLLKVEIRPEQNTSGHPTWNMRVVNFQAFPRIWKRG
jgi:dTDP-D-glucose 4,6-dehydratase